MIKAHSRLRVQRLSLSVLHVTECQRRYAGRLMHYIDLMRWHPDDDPGVVSVQPSKHFPGMYELLDGHHRYCAALMTGRIDLLCLIIEEPDDDERELIDNS